MSDPVVPSGVSLGKAASFALTTFKAHPGPLIGLAAIVTMLQFVTSIGTAPLENLLVACTDTQSPGQVNACNVAMQDALGPLAIAAVFSILAVVALIGVQRAALQATVGGTPSFAALFTTRSLGKYLLYALVSSLIIVVGVVLCIVPGIIAFYLLQLGAYVVLDRNAGVGTAIRESSRLVRANGRAAVTLILVHLAGLLVGSLFLGIPTLVVLPFTTLFTAHVYRQFQARSAP